MEEVIDLTEQPNWPALPPMLPPAAAAQPDTVDLTADTESDSEIDLVSSSEEEEVEETLAQRVKRRAGRRQAENPYSYQSLAQQQGAANREAVALRELLEVRDVPGMGRGLFARANLQRHQLHLTYFGRHYRSKTQVDAAFPNDENAYIMEHNGEYFDGEPVEQLAKYVNHSRRNRNLDFVESADNPMVQLELRRDVRAGEQLFADYGSDYPYEAHGFTRDS
jgi:hypothetical protein